MPSNPDTSCTPILQVLFFYTVGCSYCRRARKKASTLTRKQYIPYWTHEVVIGRSPTGLRELWEGFTWGDGECDNGVNGCDVGGPGGSPGGSSEVTVTEDPGPGEKMVYSRQDGNHSKSAEGVTVTMEHVEQERGGVFGWGGRRKQFTPPQQQGVDSVILPTPLPSGNTSPTPPSTSHSNTTTTHSDPDSLSRPPRAYNPANPNSPFDIYSVTTPPPFPRTASAEYKRRVRVNHFDPAPNITNSISATPPSASDFPSR